MSHLNAVLDAMVGFSRYATATGLVERFADAYSSAVPASPYAATDPVLLLWVHAAFVDSGLAAMRLFSTSLRAPDADQYVGEMTIAAELLGVPHYMIPQDVAALERYTTAVRPQLRCTPAAAEVMAWLLDPPGLEEEISELWQHIREAAVTALPGWAREVYGCPAPARLTPGRRAEIRQALGLLDAATWASRACSWRGSGSPGGSGRRGAGDSAQACRLGGGGWRLGRGPGCATPRCRETAR
jgi:uncharacterized protein (DUF2236 family)